MADDNDMCDWAADCDEEGQEWAVRDGEDSGVVMMAAVAADNDSKGRQQQQQTTTACKIGRRPMKGMDKSGRQEMAETWSGDDGCGDGRWWRWTTAAVDDDNGNGGRQQQ